MHRMHPTRKILRIFFMGLPRMIRESGSSGVGSLSLTHLPSRFLRKQLQKAKDKGLTPFPALKNIYTTFKLFKSANNYFFLIISTLTNLAPNN
jgi:hypothetical protein